jgi:hypothetical protein
MRTFVPHDQAHPVMSPVDHQGAHSETVDQLASS